MSNTLYPLGKLTEQDTKRLFRLLQTNPTPDQLSQFAASCRVEETSPTSPSRKTLESQMLAAVSWMRPN